MDIGSEDHIIIIGSRSLQGGFEYIGFENLVTFRTGLDRSRYLPNHGMFTFHEACHVHYAKFVHAFADHRCPFSVALLDR